MATMRVAARYDGELIVCVPLWLSDKDVAALHMALELSVDTAKRVEDDASETGLWAEPHEETPRDEQ